MARKYTKVADLPRHTQSGIRAAIAGKSITSPVTFMMVASTTCHVGSYVAMQDLAPELIADVDRLARESN